MNDQQRAVMQMALEALEGGLWDYGPGQDEHAKCDEVITALRDALAQPQVSDYDREFWGDGQPHPPHRCCECEECVAYFVDSVCESSFHPETWAQPQDHSEQHLNMVQGEWVDLTDDDFNAAFKKHPNDFARAVIAKFKEKNTPPVVQQGEPVAWMFESPYKGVAPQLDICPHGGKWKPLYTTPPSVEAAIEATKEKAAKVCESKVNVAEN